MEANGSVYEKRGLRENAVFRKKNGALERTRTFTPFGHNHLKVACLPIPPRAHNIGHQFVIDFRHMAFLQSANIRQHFFEEN